MAQAETQNQKVRLAFRIGYLGDGFYGSQFQPGVRTVEGEIRDACLRAGLFPEDGSAHLALSGRTDRGVHARCQIAAFSTRYPDRAKRAFPGQLPPDIWVTGVCDAGDGYSPRRDVTSRTYRYIFPHLPPDIQALEEGASLFVGRHDFTCFARIEPGKTPIRSVQSLTVHTTDRCCWFEITAPSFLWHMVRCIATVLMQASEGLTSRDEISTLLTGRCHNKVKPAPPDGLILWHIDDRLDWEVVTPLNKTLRLHDQEMARHRLMARVHTLLRP